MLTREQLVPFIANVIKAAAADGTIVRGEMRVIQKIGERISADEAMMMEAIELVTRGDYRLTPVGRFSDKVKNLEDMMLSAMIDGELSEEEKKVILSFARNIHIGQEQLKVIAAETRAKIDLQRTATNCTACDAPKNPEDVFCPECGRRL